jgi:hypothetical protein
MAASGSTPSGEYNLSNLVGSFVDVARRVLFQPASFFAAMPRSGPLLNPLVFALICIEISVLLSALLVLVGVQRNPGFNPNPQTALPSVYTPGSALLSIILAPIFGAIGLFIAAAIQQLLVRLVVGANNSGFAATFRVAAYTQVTGLINWIPILGPLLSLYGLYLAIVGIREAHDTTTGRAALVILIPFAVALLVALIVLLTLGIAFLSQI